MTFYSSEGKLIHYKFLNSGRDQTLVFIHSLGTDFRIWEEVVGIVETQVNVLLYDLRGHGLSGFAPAPGALDDYTDDLIELLTQLGINNKIIPIGISVGGQIAQLLAGRWPEPISKLILCDTCYKIGSELTWNDRIKKVTDDGLAGISADVVERWFSTAFKSENPARVQGYQKMLERTPLAGYIQTCAAIRDTDTMHIAVQIKVPTLCLVGADDKSTTPEDVKKLAELIKGSTYILIEESGHLTCIDNPIKMGRLILGFLAE